MARDYGNQEPLHWADPTAGMIEPGLAGVSAYDAGRHWHLVSLGLSEIWFKENDNPDVSGFGLEYTMRIRRKRGEVPPAWSISLLQRLGRATFDGRRFGSGHTLDPSASITGDERSELRAMCFVTDPQLGAIWTSHGRVEFLQVVGITTRELDHIKSGRLEIEQLAGRDGLYLTDPRR